MIVRNYVQTAKTLIKTMKNWLQTQKEHKIVLFLVSFTEERTIQSIRE